MLITHTGLSTYRILNPPHPPLSLPIQGTISKSYEIINTDRATLGRISGTIARQHGDKGFAGSIKLTLKGSGGQSFGCFCIQGLDVKLVGEANDYVGKGMNGGDIAIVPPPNSSFKCVHAWVVVSIAVCLSLIHRR